MKIVIIKYIAIVILAMVPKLSIAQFSELFQVDNDLDFLFFTDVTADGKGDAIFLRDNVIYYSEQIDERHWGPIKKTNYDITGNYNYISKVYSFDYYENNLMDAFIETDNGVFIIINTSFGFKIKEFVVGIYLHSLDFTDLNNDGLLDLNFWHKDRGHLYYENVGGEIDTIPELNSLFEYDVFYDFDKDGLKDGAVLNGSGQLSFNKNLGDFKFSNSSIFLTSVGLNSNFQYSRKIDIIDLDDDGNIELLVSNSSEGTHIFYDFDGVKFNKTEKITNAKSFGYEWYAMKDGVNEKFYVFKEQNFIGDAAFQLKANQLSYDILLYSFVQDELEQFLLEKNNAVLLWKRPNLIKFHSKKSFGRPITLSRGLIKINSDFNELDSISKKQFGGSHQNVKTLSVQSFDMTNRSLVSSEIDLGTYETSNLSNFVYSSAKIIKETADSITYLVGLRHGNAGISGQNKDGFLKIKKGEVSSIVKPVKLDEIINGAIEVTGEIHSNSLTSGSRLITKRQLIVNGYYHQETLVFDLSNDMQASVLDSVIMQISELHSIDLDGDGEDEIIFFDHDLNENETILQYCLSIYENINGKYFQHKTKDTITFFNEVSPSFFTHKLIDNVLFKDANNDGIKDIHTFTDNSDFVVIYLKPNFKIDRVDTLYHFNNRYFSFLGWNDLNNDGFIDLAINLNDTVFYILNDKYNGVVTHKQILSSKVHSAQLFQVDGKIFLLAKHSNPSRIITYSNDLFKSKYKVSGVTFFDSNGNGFRDSGEQLLANLPVEIDGKACSSDANGQYVYFLDEGMHDFSGQTKDVWKFSVNNKIQKSTNDSQTDLVVDIPYTFDGVEGVKVDIVNSFPRCFAPMIYWVKYTNNSATIMDGTLQVSLDLMTTLDTSFTISDSIVNNQIYYSFSNLEPGEVQMVHLRVTNPDFNAIGQQLKATVTGNWKNKNRSGIFAGSTSDGLRCAYDPNDKTSKNDSLILPGDILKYNVRFQNTGNDTAFSVKITDQLSENLDWSTFNSLSTSHNGYYEIDRSGKLSYFFNDIFLPDSNVNEAASHGYFSYEIRSQKNLFSGQKIHNTAKIYFDYNAPIVTNTTTNTIDCISNNSYTFDLIKIDSVLYSYPGEKYQWFINGIAIQGAINNHLKITQEGVYTVEVTNDRLCKYEGSLSTEGFEIISEKSGSVKVFPNPTTNQFQIICNNSEEFSIALYDLNGKLQKEENNCSNGIEVDVSQMKKGIYIGAVWVEGKLMTFKLVVQ